MVYLTLAPLHFTLGKRDDQDDTDLAARQTAAAQKVLNKLPLNYTPGSGEHGNPVFNRGSGGGARGCGFEERVGVHARTGGIQFT